MFQDFWKSIAFVVGFPGFFTCPTVKSIFEDKGKYEPLVKRHWRGKTEALGEKPAPLQLNSKQNLNGQVSAQRILYKNVGIQFVSHREYTTSLLQKTASLPTLQCLLCGANEKILYIYKEFDAPNITFLKFVLYN
jgi:hypothetical protein